MLIKKETKIMKILKINSGKAYYSFDGKTDYEIDKISKDDLLKLLDVFLSRDCDMDEYNEASIANKAHQIIYKSLYSKFKDLEEKRQLFNEESDKVYKDAIEFYSNE